MYIPTAFRMDDLAEQHALMRTNSFATLITTDAEGGLFTTHLPILLDSESGELGTLRAHIARANPQWRHFQDGREVLVLFQGAHAYISPSWYETQPAVPTWNYEAVHAYGTPSLLDAEGLRTLLYAMVTLYEGTEQADWRFETEPGYVEALMRGIVGFEIPITRLEGKRKMSQNRSEADRRQVAAALRASGRAMDAEVAELVLPTESASALS